MKNFLTYEDGKELGLFLTNWKKIVKNNFNLNFPIYIDTFVSKNIGFHKAVEDLEKTNKGKWWQSLNHLTRFDVFFVC